MNESNPILELRALVKEYGRVQALDGLDLTVCEGEVFGFLGRNGAGKSTAIRVIMGITRATCGEVRLFGQAGARGKDRIRQRQRIGYVAQEQSFYGWMTPRQLGRFVGGFYPTWDNSEFERLLGALELPATRKTSTFSGGMKVKLALALALAHRPALLVLDEPTAGLDPVARREFLEMVSAQAAVSQRTTFFSTHLVDEIEAAAHRVGIVDGGRAVFVGSRAELLERVCCVSAPVIEGAPPPVPPPLELGGEGATLRALRDEIVDGQRVIAVTAVEPSALTAWLDGASGWAPKTLTFEEAFIELVGARGSALFAPSLPNAGR